MRMLTGSLYGAAAFILSTAVAFEQATVELNGRVTDESGAVLPGVTGTQSVELRLETFNLLNHFNWGDPTVNLDAANFGRIQLQAGSSRIPQFGVKYCF